jgi:hypothetical protein
MWGWAYSWSPKHWRLGVHDAVEDDGRVVGVWLCLGPIALCYDYE